MRANGLRKSKSPYPLGAHLYDDASGKRMLHAAFLMPECAECGIVLLREGKKPQRIVFPKEYAFGSVMSAELSLATEKHFRYMFFADGKQFPDPYARVFPSHREWGKPLSAGELYAGVSPEKPFDWGEDKRPSIPVEDLILYGIHVRGFTRGEGAKVKRRGTFAGVAEKLSYIKELGANALVLMPAYTFLEREKPEEKVNYWGFKEGFYYAPNGTYSAGKDPEEELKELIRDAHLLGMEILLQFYFPRSFRRGEILPVLTYYRIHYHVDGFRLLGEELPMLTICEDPLLSDCRLLHEAFPFGALCTKDSHLFSMGRDFARIMRSFVKGDEGALTPALEAFSKNGDAHGRINCLADYDGMRLMDVFSYERKHNEANGEENRDGPDYNYSWNCGAEGPTRKKSILSLRLRLLKNALCLLFLSRGVPYLFMGDEAGSSQQGDNNPYCQDNDISWINWRSSSLRRSITAFTQRLIRLRREYPCLVRPAKTSGRDGKRTGYPDFSLHGEEAFRPDLMSYSRQAGLYYNGSFYGCRDLYIALNLHWMPHRFALPGKGMEIILETDEKKECRIFTKEGRDYLTVPDRTICLCTFSASEEKAEEEPAKGDTRQKKENGIEP